MPVHRRRLRKSCKGGPAFFYCGKQEVTGRGRKRGGSGPGTRGKKERVTEGALGDLNGKGRNHMGHKKKARKVAKIEGTGKANERARNWGPSLPSGVTTPNYFCATKRHTNFEERESKQSLLCRVAERLLFSRKSVSNGTATRKRRGYNANRVGLSNARIQTLICVNWEWGFDIPTSTECQ